jgi:hypothetical protein
LLFRESMWMGQRGPRAGAKYRKRVLVPRELKVSTDRQLVAAQHFNDWIESVLDQMDKSERYPLSGLEPAVVAQFIEAAEVMQGSIIEGIESYSRRCSPPNHVREGEEGESFLPGSYEIGRKRGR